MVPRLWTVRDHDNRSGRFLRGLPRERVHNVNPSREAPAAPPMANHGVIVHSSPNPSGPPIAVAHPASLDIGTPLGVSDCSVLVSDSGGGTAALVNASGAP